jgi:pilus assembly protein Flp/PilA
MCYSVAVGSWIRCNLALCLRRTSGETRGKEDTPMLFAPKDRGQGLVEYALILVLVAVVVIVILALLGPAIGNVFSNIVGNI